MTAAAEETADNVTELPVTGPGERLRAARIAAGLEVDRIAAQLHLKPGQVEELERDHYDSFDARVFVRGYLRNYARLVGLPVDSVLEAFDTLYPESEDPELKRVGSHKPQVSSRHGMVRLVSWLLLLGILGLFAVWWAGYLELNDEPVASLQSPGETSDNSAVPALPLAEGDGDASLALPPPPQPAAPLPAETGVAVSGPGGLPDATARPEPESAAPAAEMEASASAAATAVQAGAPRVELSLAGPCWVEIRATDGSYKLLGEFQAGTHRVLGGKPPYKILLGNAAVASLTVDGRAFDLEPHTRQQIARFILDPVAQ
jgi:cytoskeleton protein RodZ